MDAQVCEFVYGRMRAGGRFAHCARAIGYAAADSPEGNRMRTQAFLLMAALMAASATASAQSAPGAAEAAAPVPVATQVMPPAAPAPQAAPATAVAAPVVTAPAAAAPAATERRARQRAAAAKKDGAAVSTSREVDLSTLVTKDSSAKPVDETRSTDRFNREGVNCSLYPARCN